MAAAAMGVVPTPPLLVRFDELINHTKDNATTYFLIKMIVLYEDPYGGDLNIKIKYNIKLFKYNINSGSRNDCNSLMKNYHSKHGYGKNCAYIGFFDKNIDDLVYSNFYKSNKTTWFLDYNVIQPNIQVENITEENYDNPPMDKTQINQVKKVLWSKAEEETYDSKTRELIETKIVAQYILPGEHIVIGNQANAVFSLDPEFITNMADQIRPEQNLIPEIIQNLHFKVVFAFLNRQLNFTSEKANHRFFVENIQYTSPQTGSLFIRSNSQDNIHDTIRMLLRELQNNTDQAYANANQVANYNNFPLSRALQQRTARQHAFQGQKAERDKISSDQRNIKKAENYATEADSNSRKAGLARTEAKKAYELVQQNDFYNKVLESRQLANDIKTQLDGITKIRQIQFTNPQDQQHIEELYLSVERAQIRANDSATEAEQINPVRFGQIRAEREEKIEREIERQRQIQAADAARNVSRFGTSTFGTSTPSSLLAPPRPAAVRPRGAAAARPRGAAAAHVAAALRKRSAEDDEEREAKKKRDKLKYLKYKQKYLELKNKINQLNN
jgi:hypothetical protein